MATKDYNLGTLQGISGYIPTSAEDTYLKLTKIVSNVLGFLTVLAGLYFLLYFVMGGINWIASGGEKDKIEKAKHQMTNAAIGLIVVVAAYGIAFIIGRVLGIEILKPALELQKLIPTP